MRKLLASIALGATIISTQALAQDRGASSQKDMTRQEAQQRADGIFQRFDANHDGIITRQEAEQAVAQFGDSPRAQRMLDKLFAGAQSITLQQFEAQSLARFDAKDINHDGVLTAAERQQARASMRAERGANPGQ